MTDTHDEQQPIRVVIEADASGRMSISVVDDRGVGHGFRLAGAKYDGSNPPLVARAVLDRRSVDAIRSYLAVWDEIQCSASRGTTSPPSHQGGVGLPT